MTLIKCKHANEHAKQKTRDFIFTCQTLLNPKTLKLSSHVLKWQYELIKKSTQISKSPKLLFLKNPPEIDCQSNCEKVKKFNNRKHWNASKKSQKSTDIRNNIRECKLLISSEQNDVVHVHSHIYCCLIPTWLMLCIIFDVVADWVAQWQAWAILFWWKVNECVKISFEIAVASWVSFWYV